MLDYTNLFDFQEPDSKLASPISLERADKILSAIKRDNYKAFVESTQNIDYKRIRFGRFPILTLIYFFSSRKLEHKLENELLEQTKYDIVLPEPEDAYLVLRNKSHKALRIYTQNIKTIVSPLEALIVMGRTFHMRQKYPIAKTTSEMKENLTTLYYLKYNRNLTFNGEDLEMERRNLTKKEKINIAISVICLVVLVAFCADLPVIIELVNPTSNENQTDVDPSVDPTTPTDEGDQTITDASQINFSSANTYTLANDISINVSTIPEEVTCNIAGDGHGITFTNFSGTPIKTLSGNLSNITVSYSNLDITTSKAIAFICERNNGTISNITLSLSGSINATKETSEEESETSVAGYVKTIENATKHVNIAGITLINTGNISDCIVTANLTLTGNEKANSSFSGIAYTNTYTVETVKINEFFNQTVVKTSGSISNCTLNGSVSSTQVDLVGICNSNYAYNNVYINGCTNNANLTQNCSIYSWNPIVGGILGSHNSGTITQCINNGNLSIVDTYIATEEETDNVSCYLGGIVAQSTSTVSYCTNNGTLSINGKTQVCLAGGIAAYSTSYLANCINKGDVTNSNTNQINYTGGIYGFSNSGTTGALFNEGNITAVSLGRTFVGGIAGYSSIIQYARNIGTITINNNSDDSDITTSVGGIVGLAAYISTNNYPMNYLDNTGAIIVNANNTYVGGVIGQNCLYTRVLHHTISNCTINVTSTSTTTWSLVGGIVGANIETISNENSYFGSYSNNYSLSSNIIVNATNKAVGTVIGALGNYFYNNPSYEYKETTYYYYTKTYFVVSESIPHSIGAYDSSVDETISYTTIGLEIAGENTADTVENISALEDYTSIKTALDNYYSQLTTNE